MITIQYGPNKIQYTVYSRYELDKMGLVPNKNIWIGPAWLFCINCDKDTYHYAMSHPGLKDCHEVCRICNCYVDVN